MPALQPTKLAPACSLIFSMDRALQVDALLRSFYLNCVEADQLELYVLYHSSQERYDQQYRELAAEYSDQPAKEYSAPRVHFVRQADFYSDVFRLLQGTRFSKAGLAWQRAIIRLLYRRGTSATLTPGPSPEYRRGGREGRWRGEGR